MLEDAKRGALKVCEGRRESEGDFEKETGDLKTSSRKSVRTALTGVIGEAIDITAESIFI